MKLLSTFIFSLLVLASFGQSETVQPVEKAHAANTTWWIVGTILALAAGIIIYLLIKKNPKKDAV